MRLPRKHLERTLVRTAFTLIELLVVIAIIAVLVALTSAAVFKILGRGPEVQTTNDITQLANALGAFKAKYGSYPPSRIRLFRSGSSYTGSQLDQDSKQYLQSVFPGLASFWAAGNAVQGWGGTQDGATLTGDQCLVFFLGGVQTNAGGVNGCLGWGTGNDPTVITATSTPMFNFQSNRLTTQFNTNGFFSYLDGWGKQPYIYFSSYYWKNANSYNRYGSTDAPPGYSIQPCFTATAPVMRYVNPQTFQIISAGADTNFGPGGQWAPQMADQYTGTGADDLCNFNQGLRMGGPPS
jgi:prepilin-type N-terminal cleavage/methylation domain-containing protein